MNDKPGKTPEKSDSSGQIAGEPKTEVVTETANPASQPMVSTTEIEAAEAAQKAEEEKKKKSHKGLIIGLIIGFLVIVGGVVGALFALGVFKSADPVVTAIAKLFDGEKPSNITVDGKISVDPGKNLPVDSLSLDFNSSIKVGSIINATGGTLTASINNKEYKVSLDEIYATSNELYLKIKGYDSISKLVTSFMSGRNVETEIECDEDDDCDDMYVVDCIDEDETDCAPSYGTSTMSMSDMVMAYVMQILEVIDDTWIRIPLDELSSTGIRFEQNTECVAGIFDSSSKNSNKLAEIYKNNAFISSTTENLSVAKKNNPIYKLVFDGEKLSSYTKELKSANIFDTSCLSENSDASPDQLNELAKQFPDMYVEVNDNSEITRFYTTMSQQGVKAEIDLSFSYPSTIDVAEPAKYYDLMDILGGEYEE